MRTVTFEVERVERETELALLLLIDGNKVWVPKSQIDGAEEIGEGDEDIEVEVAEWWAEKEGLV